MRIQFWLANRSSDVDVAQEIDFLLGICLKPKFAQNFINNSNKNSSNNNFNMNNKSNNYQNQEIDPELVKEIGELKVIVLNMKEKIKKNENERKKFISQNLSSILPSNSSWSQICSYLIHHHPKTKNETQKLSN